MDWTNYIQLKRNEIKNLLKMWNIGQLFSNTTATIETEKKERDVFNECSFVRSLCYLQLPLPPHKTALKHDVLQPRVCFRCTEWKINVI